MTKTSNALDDGRRIVLVLQGGGALGSYQAGVVEALSDNGIHPTWFAGTSIGAINAAIVAGNAPEHRVAKLRAFWEKVTSPTALLPHNAQTSEFERQFGASLSMLMGQPGFFSPRPPTAWWQKPAVSSYDTKPLEDTLNELVDFDRINHGETWLSVNAVNVRTGVYTTFANYGQTTDTGIHRIERVKFNARHIMASGAIPPAFPPVEIEGQSYWDGGLLSNSPLMNVLDHEPRNNSVVFQVDLYQAFGEPPTTMEDALERDKDIRYASRTRTTIRIAEREHNVRAHAQALWDKLPPMLRDLPEAQFLDDLRCTSQMDIALLIYRPFEPQGSSKDFEFSRGTMQSRWDRGREDAEITLDASPWLLPFPAGRGTRISDVLHDRYVAQMGVDAAKPAKQA